VQRASFDVSSPIVSRPSPADARRETQRLRIAMQRLAIGAGLGTPPHDLAKALHDIWCDAFDADEHETLALPARQRLAAELLAGTCATARWLDPARSMEAVAPLCVVLWHVGALHGRAHPATLWLDLVVPGDGRKAAALEWAFDVRLLLAEADIPHCADTVQLGDRATTTADTAPAAPGVIEVWGCMSLYHHYDHSGMRSRQRAAFEPRRPAAQASALGKRPRALA
jgi:hypothetical protein